MGQSEVVQTGDVQYRNFQVERGFAVGRVECAIPRRVPIDSHGHVERFLDVRHRPFDVYYQAIGMGLRHRQAMRFREANDGVAIVQAGAEALGKLFHAEVSVIVGALGIVDLLQQIVEIGLMAQRQGNRQAHALGARHLAGQRGLPVDHRRGDMRRQGQPLLRLG